jgi:drug/metabolite transporter (DMT)-like permease
VPLSPIGVFFGLSAALVWSSSSLIVKAQAARIDTFSFNAFRLLVAAVFFLLLLAALGGLEQLFSLSASVYLALGVSVILGFCIGDSLYFWSMTEIGASRAMPLSGVYPVFTWLLAVPLLGEDVTVAALIGTALIIVALVLLARESAVAEANEFILTAPEKSTGRARSTRRQWLAVAGAIFAALTWASSTTLLRFAMREDPGVIVISAYRLTVGGLVLLPVLYWLRRGRPWTNYRRANMPSLVALALFSTGLGSMLFVWAVEFAGAARASLLITTSPLIGVPLSAIFLKERITPAVWIGTLLALAGVWLVLM